MVKTLMMSAALSTLMITGAMAQGTQPAPAPAAPAAKDATPADSSKFVQRQNPDQFVFSKFKGTDVIGPDNAKVGDVNDMIFDKSGKLIGLVVGVGGFLGIGEKDVAMDMGAFQVVPADTGSSTTGTASRASNDPTDVKLKVSWTKDQLKNAPDFEYHKAASTASPTTGTTPRPGSPPRQ
jgi:hypothetical protein